VPAWDELQEADRRVHARYMEAFAAYLSHTDAELGRLLDRLAALGELDDTMVVVLSDNGASSEGGPVGSLNDVRAWNVLPQSVEEATDRLDEIGGPRIHNNYPWGWTVAGNTPFRRWKRETHEGGVADPLIVHWPRGIAARGEVRRQYVHAVDVVPTVLEAIGVVAPAVVGGVEQRPLDGISFAYSFDDGAAPERHSLQYYEMFGCRALYRDGWKAVTYHPIQADEPGLDAAPWELYDLRADPTECHDLAGAEPARLESMVEAWWREAERNGVLPIDNRPFSEMVFGRPPAVPDRHLYTYWPGRPPVPESAAVNVRGRPHSVTAHVSVGDGDGPVEGVLAVQGSVLGGWSFHLLGDGRLVYVYNLAGWRTDRVEAALPAGRLAPGDHTLAMRFDPPGVELLVDGEVIGAGEVPRTAWARLSLTGAGLTAGWSPDFSPADQDYRGRFAFTRTLHRVDIEVRDQPTVDPVAEAEAAISAQ
jgi:arylsulfatase